MANPTVTPMPQADPQNMQAADWKSELAGLAMPPEPSAWPPSWAAVLLTLTLTLATTALIYVLVRKYRAGAWRREALKELEQIRHNTDSKALSRLLRRVARNRIGPDAASLGDSAFANLLTAHHSADIPEDLAEELACCAHRPMKALDARHFDAAGSWIRTC